MKKKNNNTPSRLSPKYLSIREEMNSRKTLPSKIGKAMKAVLTMNRLKAASINISTILSRNLIE